MTERHTDRYGIAEWFGEPLAPMPAGRRQELARFALHDDGLAKADMPPCPFQPGNPPCSKKGGVCSIRIYRNDPGDHPPDRIGEPHRLPVITCSNRFAQDSLIPRWLAEIVGFDDVFLAREVPFMLSPETGRPAGRIDLIISGDEHAAGWFGVELQAVYFSGKGMPNDFRNLRSDSDAMAPLPTNRRRPDWRSSSAKRLMLQLQVKAPTLRRWGMKLAVVVDEPFFTAIGGPTPAHERSQDLNEGDVIWLVPRISSQHRLTRGHWEVLSLAKSRNKLLAAQTIPRADFEASLRAKLQRIP